METVRTPEEEVVYQQYLAEATAMIVELNRRISEQADKETTFCSAGCTACCNQLFHLNMTHLFVILQRLENDPGIRAKFDQQNAKRKKMIEEQLETIKELSKLPDNLAFANAWNALKIPCALLYEGKCLIYDIRPVACSTYLTLSPPRVCAIDPRGYLSMPMKQLKYEFGVLMGKLNARYGIKGEPFFDLSWHLDNFLNLSQEEPAKKPRKKKS